MDPFIAAIVMFGGNFAPRGWAFCDGQLLPISQNTALFSILGTTFGGDGRTTFALPDLRGRAPLHPGTGPGLTPRNLGQRSGSETNTLTSSNLPPHTHAATGTTMAYQGDADSADPQGNNFGEPDTNKFIYTDQADNVLMRANNVQVTISNAGASIPVNNMQPWLGINYIIAMQGIFPSRN